ncbi:Nucleolar protein 12 [Zalaria obscura]|uniref:Nucleolar protein 12 n=1 Tax=Zalaria obscura TaxID=2024903 RepID=A0ACC3SGM2_9PEZI
MAKHEVKEKKHKDRKEKKDKKGKDVVEGKESKSNGVEHSKSKAEKPKVAPGFSLAVSGAVLDPTLSLLFANSVSNGFICSTRSKITDISLQLGPSVRPEPVEVEEDVSEVEEDDEVLSEIDEEIEDDEEAEVDGPVRSDDVDVDMKSAQPTTLDALVDGAASTRKRKRKEKHEELEDVYMRKLDREEEKAKQKAKEERQSKRQKKGDAEEADPDAEDESEDEAGSDAVDGDEDEYASNADSDDEGATPPPKHETVVAEANSDLNKSQRTVFLSNVSTKAITSKVDRKKLMAHLASFFPSIDAPKAGQPAHKVESLRFRSTAFSTPIPKKAAFANNEIMNETSACTNAYAVYSSTQLAREAARRLNGTIVLDRHLRVDEVAHPAPTDHKRCVFVGNLAFVNDESNIDAANEAEGKGKRHGNKVPADVEEGLWRTFGKCGKVESVRVIRDPKTRVGKGFAYVQFADANGEGSMAVEQALQLNEKRFPPMLPRKLRVSRARAVKRNAKPGQVKAPHHEKKMGYNPRLTAEQQSLAGRAGRLLGKAGAAQIRSGKPAGPRGPRDTAISGMNIKTPESFVFEGHRATAGQGKSGLKLGGSGKKGKGKPRTRSSKRGAAWKASGGKKASK